MIWHGTPEDIEKWFDNVFKEKDKRKQDEFVFVINDDNVG